MPGDIRSLVVAHPLRTHIIIAPTLAFFALSPIPHLLPIVLLVASLRVWAWVLLPRFRDHRYGIPQLIAVSLAGGAGSLGPSLRALSSISTSLFALSLKSLATSFVMLFVIAGATRVDSLKISSPWSKLALFPAIWASASGFISYASPIGQLATWSPVSGLGPYQWVRPFLGQWGIDWIVGAWAAIVSQVIGDWVVGSPDQAIAEAQEPDLIEINEGNRVTTNSTTLSHKSYTTLALTSILGALMLPSYAVFDKPLPANSASTTHFSVGCVSPLPYRTGFRVGLATLDDYIKETKSLQSHANIMLWPETAVRFDSPVAKEEGFSKIQAALDHGKYVGVGFEDYLPAELNNGSHKAIRRNGFALLGYKDAPAIEYYKRSLVPIAESYRFTPGDTPPTTFTINLGPPKSVKAPDWAPGPNFTRPIPVTAAICLDFASPSTFAELKSKPALILAPASTWHTGIGYAMWEQAKARAAETGSPVVWCDGGEGAVGGVVGGGYNEIVQVGEGSWTKTIGIQWPFNQHPTFFMGGRKSAAFGIVWALFGAGWAVEWAIVSVLHTRGPRFGRLVAFIAETYHRVGALRGRKGIRLEEGPDLLG